MLRSKKGFKNKNRKIKPAISTEQAWSIKVLFYGQNKNRSLRDKARNTLRLQRKIRVIGRTNHIIDNDS